jgi:phage-related holin
VRKEMVSFYLHSPDVQFLNELAKKMGITRNELLTKCVEKLKKKEGSKKDENPTN